MTTEILRVNTNKRTEHFLLETNKGTTTEEWAKTRRRERSNPAISIIVERVVLNFVIQKTENHV
jgi:hypothetical protein